MVEERDVGLVFILNARGNEDLAKDVAEGVRRLNKDIWFGGAG
jgi:hypothetical protein